MSETKHTPTPFGLELSVDADRPWIIVDSHGNGIAVVDCDFNAIYAEDEQYARFIVKAVNSHDALINALRQVLPFMEAAEKAGLVGDEGCMRPVEIVRAALAEVDGE